MDGIWDGMGMGWYKLNIFIAITIQALFIISANFLLRNTGNIKC